MNRLDQIKRILTEQKPMLRERYGVEELGIFGSYLRGTQQNKSDLDLLVCFSGFVSLLEFIHIENYLSELLGVKVDLVMKDALKPRIGKRILNEVESVVGQTVRPLSWIELVRMPERNERHFAGKVPAFKPGYAQVKDLGWDIVGNLSRGLKRREMRSLRRPMAQNCEPLTEEQPP